MENIEDTVRIEELKFQFSDCWQFHNRNYIVKFSNMTRILLFKLYIKRNCVQNIYLQIRTHRNVNEIH